MASTPTPPPVPPTPGGFAGVSGIMAGLGLGLLLLKVGNPVVMSRLVPAPATLEEVLFQGWPVPWAWFLMLLVGVAVVPFARLPKARMPGTRVLIGCLVVWFAWQWNAARTSIDLDLSSQTLIHFAGCVVCYGLGITAFWRLPGKTLALSFLVLAYCMTLSVGFDQHFGGLEATRKYVEETVGIANLHPEHQKRIASNRIFSTFLYPNVFAGALLLITPLVLFQLNRLLGRFPDPLRWAVLGAMALGGAASLVWTGSKSGWLIALLMSGLAVLHSTAARRLKVALVVVGLGVGLAFFFARYAGYFQRGATSVSARFDYWEAAWTTVKANPWDGSGPGTFGPAYQRIKRPESEMARLAHNDFVQQASDSGWVGALAYAGFWFGSVLLLYRYRVVAWEYFSVWLGLFGFVCQSMVEFGLYIPALAWLAFLMVGWLTALAAGGDSDGVSVPV